MQMRAEDPVPTPLPLHSLLLAPARLGVSILPPLRSLSHILPPTKPVLPPGDVLVTGHGCVPRAALSAHSLSVQLGWAVPVPCHTEPRATGPLLWSQRSLAKATSSQGHSKAPGTRGVPWSRSHPHCCAQVGTKVMPGSLEAMGGDRHLSVLCHANLVPVPTAGHCSAGTVLMLHGLRGRSPLGSQSCTPSAPYALRISTDQAQGRAQDREGLS